jgi:antagonist of KipI
MKMITILSPGFLTTVQDLGWVGYERLGVPGCGAMDRVALMAANALVGNPLGAAGLEFALLGPSLRAETDCLAAAAGRGFELEVGGRRLPAWMAAWVRRGEEIALHSADEVGDSGWGYLALSGGIDVAPVMGSRSTYLRGGFGGLEGRALQAGDGLALGSFEAESAYERAGLELPAALRPAYSERPQIEVVAGPQTEAFSAAGLAAFFEGEYALTPACDRMGYRLAGPLIAHRASADLLSEGIALGAVQVPGDGQPIVLMADRQTAGGYPKIGVVTSASLPLLVQCPPGTGKVRFRAVPVEQAQQSWRDTVRQLRKII